MHPTVYEPNQFPCPRTSKLAGSFRRRLPAWAAASATSLLVVPCVVESDGWLWDGCGWSPWCGCSNGLSMTARLEEGCDDLKRLLSSGFRLRLPGSSRDILDSILEQSRGSGGPSPSFTGTGTEAAARNDEVRLTAYFSRCLRGRILGEFEHSSYVHSTLSRSQQFIRSRT
jgi:hypothetical protein